MNTFRRLVQNMKLTFSLRAGLSLVTLEFLCGGTSINVILAFWQAGSVVSDVQQLEGTRSFEPPFWGTIRGNGDI